MWSQVLLFLLVGFAYASENPAWTPTYHYVYQVNGRSLASLNQISNDYSGILFKADLQIQPKSDGDLAAQIVNAQYAKVHAELEDGWETEIPDSQLQYQPLGLSQKPFQISLHKGVVRNVIVNKQIKNWEANMIKSIVSQLQLDTKAVNVIQSSINVLTQDDSNSAVFKTMEETITGVSETLYEIHPFPEYVLQSKPWVAPQQQFIEQGDIIEVVKSKNFSHSEQVLSYHAGLEGVSGYKPENKVGEFLTRSSVSQAVITGSLKQYTIQSSVTVEEIVLSPTLSDAETGSVNSKLNLTLKAVASPLSDGQYQVENPVEVGLVYAYNNPFSTDNSPRPLKEYDHGVAPSSAESESPQQFFSRRSSKKYRGLGAGLGADLPAEEEWHQDKPQLNEAPPSPLLPFTVGHDGQSIKKQQNIVETVRRLAQEIGQEFLHPKDVLHQQTAGKFVVLTSLVRILDENEIDQVASQLHSSSEESPAWVAFRDAVAQSGTGPAIKNIKKWIQSGTVDNIDAALIISVAADAARQPTEEYIKFFFSMVQDHKIMYQPYLNESLLLSYSTLLRKVYANEHESTGKYPVHSYGSFLTNRGKDYVKKTVIPYFTRQLNEAINEGDTEGVHIYIRALGNIALQEILEAFEPYLEGKRQASHFQRTLMVLSLGKLTESNPRVARSVLYKIYQNPSEAEPVRVAAVYQLMRTRPSAAMLQRMASYTNVDPNHYVNAAVKSSIESAADLEAPEHDELRAAAQSAEPLLTSQEYGEQYSAGYLRSYADDELSLAYQQHVQTFGGEDHAVPKGFKYILQQQLGGVSQNIINAQAIASSVEDLVNVFQQQTKEYQHQQKEKQAQNAPSKPWSSEYVAKLLNLQNEQREQLEGNLYLHIGAFEFFQSFDNQTLENLTEVIQEIEHELQQGKHFEFNKLLIEQESSLALPTVLGLPFIYTYDTPLLINMQVDLKANAQPQISDGNVLQLPDVLTGDFDINAVVTGKIQTQLGIFTPFDHQRYSAGYHKNLQVVVPLSGKFQLNTQKQELKVEVQNPGSQESIRLGHYSSWPYTSQSDIYSPKPALKLIRSDNPYKKQAVFGDKSAGVAVYFQITSDERIDVTSIYENFYYQDPIAAILKPLGDEHIQYVHVDIGIDGGKSTTQQITLYLGYLTEYQENDSASRGSDPDDQISDIPSFAEDREKRQKEFLGKAGRDIHDANVFAGDATVEFSGQSKIIYSVTVGVGKSNVDPKGRFIALVQKFQGQQPQTQAYVQAVAQVPNTNGLDLDYAMQMDPKSEVYVQGLLRQQQGLSRASAKIELSKTAERVHHLKQQEEYKKCKHEMAQGNTQLPTCARLTARANLLDKVFASAKYSDMDSRVINATYKAYSFLRHYLYPRVEENIVDPQPDNRFDFHVHYSPELEYVNASFASEYGKAEIKNVPLSPWAREFLVPHPVFHIRSRLEGQIRKHDTYRPICVVDKTHTNTFDNKTYPSSLANDWTVVLQYVPRRPSPVPNKPDQTVPEQLYETVDSYVVFTRAAQQGSSQKEVQIFLQTPPTQGKIVKIELKPAREGKGPKVLVNDQEVKYTDQAASSFYQNHIQVYALPNQEVKVEISEAFYVIFNGQTLKITAVNSKFRDSSRGLCGTFTGEPETDFLTPDNCIIGDPRQFVQSYTVGSRQPARRSAENQQCFQKQVEFADYISNQDAGRSSDEHRGGEEDCTGHISRYQEEGGEICFTIRALPYCKSGCKPLHLAAKQVDVHCLLPSANTAYWRSQLDKNIQVDFSMMQKSKELAMDVPSRCSP